MDYNLIEDPWIPVLFHNGKWERVGIRKALVEAGQIRQIAASNPMDRVAIIRFLLAVLYWCKGNPPPNLTTPSKDGFPSEWFAKLDENKECFNLLGGGKRFYQDPTARRARAVTDLIQEIPAGNNFWHFRHSTDGEDGLCLSCCVLGLLRLPLFSVSGLPDLKAGINGTPPVYAIPLGNSLYETLCINWVSTEVVGIPAWVQSTMQMSKGEVVPLLTGLTLLSRRVMLHEPLQEQRVCINCGSKEKPVILTCEYQTAGEQKNDQWNDPHVVYTSKTPRTAIKAPDLRASGKFKTDRPWFETVIQIAEDHKFATKAKPKGLLITGFSTNKALNVDVWERTIELPSAGITPDKVGESVRRWQKGASDLSKRVRPEAEKASTRKYLEIQPVIDAIRPHVESRVSAKIRDLLEGSDTAWDQAAQEYRPMMEAVAGTLSPSYTTSALQRRRRISSTTPDMRPKAVPDKKPGRMKGGKK